MRPHIGGQALPPKELGHLPLPAGHNTPLIVMYLFNGCCERLSTTSDLLDLPNLEHRTGKANFQDPDRCAGFELTFPDRRSRILPRFP